MSSSVGSWMSCCQRGEELLLGVITGKGCGCQVESVFDDAGEEVGAFVVDGAGPWVVDCSGGGVGGALAGESAGSASGVGD